jgi:hypothetical protein
VEVARRLSAGGVTLVTVSSWGFVADFLAFLDEIGFYLPVSEPRGCWTAMTFAA